MIPGLEILNLHAQGGMAEVYRARGKGADGRTWMYAVKRILPELTQDPELRRMFAEEARIASMLVHPNIVRVYDLARGNNDDYYIVMEFLEGRDLAETIDKAHDEGRTLPIWLCIHAAREVLKALVYATTQARDREGRPLGLIHRDISPHNIFVCFDGQVKLTDFGVAKVAQSNVLTQVGVTKGKFGYMSPEQLLSEKLDFRSDLYNVGILLYELLTRRRLFFGDNPSQFLQAMLKAEVPPLDRALGVPPELEALIRRALSKEREGRPATAQAFDDELRAIAERYRLLATPEHVSGEIRAIFGSEIESCPVPQAHQPSIPRQLASVQVAQPDAVRRVPSRIMPVPQADPQPQQLQHVQQPAQQPHAHQPQVPQAQRPRTSSSPASHASAQGAPQIWPPAQATTNGLSDPAIDVKQLRSELERESAPSSAARASSSPQPERRPSTRPQGPSLASASTGSGSVSRAVRPGTRSVRALPEPGDVPQTDPATLPPDDPAVRFALTSSGPPKRSDDPSTLPPDGKSEKRKPTVIVVGGAGALPLSERPTGVERRTGDRRSPNAPPWDGEERRRAAERRDRRDGDRREGERREGERRDPERRSDVERPDVERRAEERRGGDRRADAVDERALLLEEDAGDWGDRTVGEPAFAAKPSVVTRSAKVVPLPSRKK